MHGPHWWAGRFRGYGCRMTMPRQAILEILTGTNKHLSAEDVYLAVHKIYPGIGLTTVYRTLELLRQMGLVFKFDFGDGRSRYELAKGPKAIHHHHLICRACGRVIDYAEFIEGEKSLLEETKNALSKKFNFKIDSHQMHFYGLCSNCQRR